MSIEKVRVPELSKLFYFSLLSIGMPARQTTLE